MHPPRPLRWLYLDLNSYFASVEQQLQPELRGRPVIVAPVDVDTTVAIAASYEAKAYGISTGTPVWEAKHKCRDIVIVPARHGLYVDYHHRVLAEVERHVPVTKVCSIDEVACRLLDNENGRDQAIALAERIKRGVAANVGECLRSSIGIAPNRLLAKMASNFQKPDGLSVVESWELPERLFSLPLRAIPGIGAKTERRLARAGILDMAELVSRRPRDAGAAWGSVLGDRLWWLLHGHELPERATVSRSIGHSHVLSPADRLPPAAHLTARRLLMKVGSRLRRKACAGRLLTLHCRFEDGGKWSGTQRIALTQDSFAMLRGLDLLWPRLLAQPKATRLRMIGVSLSDIEAVAHDQPSLFEHLHPDTPLAQDARRLRLAQAMDRMNARFGRNAVTLGPLAGRRIDGVGTRIAFNHIPEKAEFYE